MERREIREGRETLRTRNKVKKREVSRRER